MDLLSSLSGIYEKKPLSSKRNINVHLANAWISNFLTYESVFMVFKTSAYSHEIGTLIVFSQRLNIYPFPVMITKVLFCK